VPKTLDFSAFLDTTLKTDHLGVQAILSEIARSTEHFQCSGEFTAVISPVYEPNFRRFVSMVIVMADDDSDVVIPEAESAEDKFAAERSHKASALAYDLCRVTAQACLLINGGAATAVLALLTKDKVDPALYRTVPWCLGLYAVGVTVSAAMMFSTMMMADHWNYFWYNVAYTRDRENAEAAEATANRWHKGVYLLFAAAIFCFIISSVILARALSSIDPR